MKKILLNIFIILITIYVHAQNNQVSTSIADYNMRMEAYINNQLTDTSIISKAKQVFGHTCDKKHILTEDELNALITDHERNNFIQANMAEYMRLYFPKSSSSGITSDTSICDNGGFEDDFLYYRGYTGLFTDGSNTCTPLYFSNPVNWIPVTMPVTNRLEIMTTGLDSLVGIQKVKFGNKSLRINNKYGHISNCNGNYGIDKVTKRFKVTEANRRFTVWYAVILENPSGHVNQQPFLNIKCDKAPADELCFDADLIKCDNKFTDSICEFDKMDVLDWACHRFTIPASEIGTIATVEMIVADCGASAHFGYAYIDGFCEECTGSSLGSINLEGSLTDPQIGIDYFSCDGLTAKVCGSFLYPTLCGSWNVESITVPGYTIQNLIIDNYNNTFCFDFPISNFGIDTCLEISTQIEFNSTLGMNLPPQKSNSIKICRNLYESYDFNVMVSSCNNNGTNNHLSDDHYYVTVDIDAQNGADWSVRRKLDNPYPGESGEYTIKTGAGSTTLNLGPFLIQDGCWDIYIDLPTCSFEEKICPPEFCSGCSEFAGLKISNIQCIPGTPETWSFDIYVPGTGPYEIDSNICTKGTMCSISGGTIFSGCKTFLIKSLNCKNGNYITVCPPRPCSILNCKIEVYPDTMLCYEGDFYIKLHTKPDSGLCYTDDPMSIGMMIPSSGIIGPFSSNTSVMIYDCIKPGCYKWIYIPKLDCGENFNKSIKRSTDKKGGISIVPNPIYSDRLTIHSDMLCTEYGIFNSMGQYITSGQFTGREAHVPFDYPAGLYYIKYINALGEDSFTKFIKK